MIARLEVTRGTLTEYPLAEKTRGGWQNGVTFYPDAEVTKVTPLIFRNDAMSHYTDPADPFGQSHPEPQGEPSDALAAEEADRRWPHTPGDPDAASARSARRLSFRQGAEWARAAGVGGVR